MKDKTQTPVATTTEIISNTKSEECLEPNTPEPPLLKFLRGEQERSANKKISLSEDPPIAIVGVGEFGCAMLECASLTLRRPYITIALDADHAGAISNTYATRKLLLTCETGAANTAPDARHLAIYKEEIERLLSGLDVVILLADLADPIGTELSLIVADTLAKHNNPTFAFAVTAYKNKEEIAHKSGLTGLEELRGRITAVLDMPCNPLEEGRIASSFFERATPLIEQFARIVASPSPTSGLIGVDVVDLISVLGGGRVLMMGCGTGNGKNSAADALEIALNDIKLDIENLQLVNGAMILLEVRPTFTFAQFSPMNELFDTYLNHDMEIKISCIPIKGLEVDARVTVLARLLSES